MRRPRPLLAAATLAGHAFRLRGLLLETTGAGCVVAGVVEVAGTGPGLIVAGGGLLYAGLIRS